MDRQGFVVVNGLSCTNCRRKKIRCTRATPACGRCSSNGLTCQYPDRRPRRTGRRDPDGNSTDGGKLSLILDRLQRIENRYISDTSSPASNSGPQRHSIDESATPKVPGSPTTQDGIEASAATPAPCSASVPILSANDSAILLEMRPNTFDATVSQRPPVDVASTLSDTFDRVRDQRLRRTVGINAITTEGVHISPELARTWIHKTFLSLVDRKMIEMMPDMLSMGHVTLDPCIIIIYYVILWRGCYVLNTRSFDSPDRKYSRQLYLCCLRAIPSWQKEATGSITDFIAAIFMTGVATECFDFEMSLQMHKLACEYAKGLQMHSLDGGDYFETIRTDDDRKGMWELIQTDLFYHLIYNKPATLYPSLDAWQVNLPWVSLDSPPDNGAQTATVSFLFRSRLTFVLIHFFQIIEKLGNESEALKAIEPLCHEVEVLFEDWGIEDWIQRSVHDQMDLWILAAIVMAGNTSIIFMLRKATLLNSNSPNPTTSDVNIPKTDFATRASRRILDFMYRMLRIWRFPAAETISYVLGAYRAHIAYAHVASNVINSPTPGEMAEDLDLLDRVALVIGAAAEEESDFVPLARAMKRINAEVREQVNRARDG